MCVCVCVCVCLFARFDAGNLRVLQIPSEHPWNSEPSDLGDLTKSFFTPNDLFFVRNHNVRRSIAPLRQHVSARPRLIVSANMCSIRPAIAIAIAIAMLMQLHAIAATCR